MSVILSESMIKSKQKGLKKWQERKRADLKKSGFKRKPQNKPRHEKQPVTVHQNGNNAARGLKSALKTILKRKRSRIKPMSEKRAAQNKEYLKIRELFLSDNPRCAIFPALQSIEVHHTFSGSKRSKYFLDPSTWMAVSRKGHSYIHDNPKISREKGWLK